MKRMKRQNKKPDAAFERHNVVTIPPLRAPPFQMLIYSRIIGQGVHLNIDDWSWTLGSIIKLVKSIEVFPGSFNKGFESITNLAIEYCLSL